MAKGELIAGQSKQIGVFPNPSTFNYTDKSHFEMTSGPVEVGERVIT